VRGRRVAVLGLSSTAAFACVLWPRALGGTALAEICGAGALLLPPGNTCSRVHAMAKHAHACLLSRQAQGKVRRAAPE